MFREHIHCWLQYHATLRFGRLHHVCFLWETVSYVGVLVLRRAAHTARFVVSVFIAPSGLCVPFINLLITIRYSEASYVFTGSHFSDYYNVQSNSILWFQWDIRTILAWHQNTGTKSTDRWSIWLHSVYIVSNVYMLILLNKASVLLTLKNGWACARVCVYPFVDLG